MRQHIQSLLEAALHELAADGRLAREAIGPIPVERARSPEHGDFASPLALSLAKQMKAKPRDIAGLVVARLPASELITKAEVAGPGFINFFLAPSAYQQLVNEILDVGERYGKSELGAGSSVQVEFVSANPTGPLHVGHGRHAAYGDVIANLLANAGYEVQREYYVNDAGRQMHILAVSVWLRYLASVGETVPFPDNGYRGDYVRGMAERLRERDAEAYRCAGDDVSAELPLDASQGGDKEAFVDALVVRAQAMLGHERYQRIYDFALHSQVEGIRADLAAFGVEFDRWYSERSLSETGAIDRALERLREAGQLYHADGALWFKSSEFGDEKDRVVQRENGERTYFASDIAYHKEKFERGFNRVIDVLGADHHGYYARVGAALAALGEDPGSFQVLIMQFVTLYRGGEKAQMSTRSGDFVTLAELREEVGRDAARFFYVMRRCEQHLDFDLDLAKSQSNDNPVYYVQYAYARICRVLQEADTRGVPFERTAARGALQRLVEAHELALLRTLSRYPEILESAAVDTEPHQLAFYLRDLAAELHTYYNAHTFLVDDTELRNARLALVSAVARVIAAGLGLLGVSAPERM